MPSMRQHLFRRFLPLILVPLAVSTIWSGAMSWTTGNFDNLIFDGRAAVQISKVWRKSQEAKHI